jgi:uncharacterized repeat protein (TIGR03803 family)
MTPERLAYEKDNAMPLRLVIAFVTLVSLSGLGPLEAAWKVSSLHDFEAGADGASPFAGVVMDASGNLYGTTYEGGESNYGTVFMLSPPKDVAGKWVESVLHSFSSSDGHYPMAGVTLDAAGNLYGTTYQGGSYGAGTVFKLTPPSSGQAVWTETILHDFSNGADGGGPLAGVVLDPVGSVYGTAVAGGTGGLVFKLFPPRTSQSSWTESVIHYFGGRHNGEYAHSGLTLDPSGNLYGTTAGETKFGNGTVFKLTPPTAYSHRWVEEVLHVFRSARDGAGPESDLLLDHTGHLYGTTHSGGRGGFGTVFEITPPTAGKGVWTETILSNFYGKQGGGGPNGVALDSNGYLYGTTEGFGTTASGGTVFVLAPPITGATAWKRTSVHIFEGPNGYNPFGILLRDSSGSLYGTTSSGGAYGHGSVFRITPQ